MNKIYGFLLLWLCHVALYAQFGGVDGSYDPSNPPNPEEPKTKYTLNLTASPQGAGNTNYSSPQAREEGAEVYISTSSNSGFVFQRWMEGDKLVSTTPSFYYKMPAHDVELRAEYKYDPTSPANPEMRGVSYNLTLVASPTGGGSFNESFRRVEENTETYLYAYTNTGYEFVGWQQDGKTISTDQRFYYTMPNQNTTLTAVFKYNPSSPNNPGANSWTKETGEVIADEFKAGSLYNAIYDLTNGNNDAVTQITVIGKVNYNDFSIANNYSHCTYLDLSRATGISSVPSYCYDNNSVLTSIVLPATIERLEYMAFYQCENLGDISCYAPIPPIVSSYALEGVMEGCVVHVPAASVGLYQEADGWKDFTILPLAEQVNSLEVNLPEGSEDGRYKNMFIELINTKSGQKLRYVVSDRMTYTFNSLMHNTQWNVYLKNAQDVVLGEIDGIDIQMKDVSVTFKDILIPRNITLTVLTPDGDDITEQTTITWTNAKNIYIAQGNSLTGLTDNTEVKYRVTLPQSLGMTYILPTEQTHIVGSDNDIVLALKTLTTATLSGVVRDVTTSQAIPGATVNISQMLNGLYSKSQNVRTDSNGQFTANIYCSENAPSLILTVSASDYISQTLDFSNNEFDGLNEFAVPDVSLKSIAGATVTLGFTYTTCDGETQNWYSDYQNVSYELFNVTKNQAISQYNVQYPQIVLLEEVADGDELRFTASSRTNAFMPVTATATIQNQKADVSFAVVELGKIQSSFASTENAAVVGSLYDASGKLLKTYDYANASLTIKALADGEYTLVSMGNSRLFNTIYDLAQLPQTGLVEGIDYVQNKVTVKSGEIAIIDNDLVPYLDESKLYYTGENTSFTVNKPSIVAGNYLTLTGRIDFKQAYATNVSNVQLIVDLPESCEFVENSVMVGNSTSSYTLNGHQITIPMARYTDRVRFCVIPILGGDYAPSAFAQFDLKGETVTQPIGSANYTAKDLSISVPSTVAKTSIPVSGTAIGQSSVELYDGDVLIGQTNSLANGTWATTCELNAPYNLSTHNIYAKVTTAAGMKLASEMKSCLYDMNAIEVKTVTMSFYNGWLKKEIQVVFDLQNKTIDQSSYMFYTTTDITFVADLTNNDTTVVNSVTIRVYTDKNNWHNLEAHYDTKTDRWVATSQFGSNELPVGVEAEIYTKREPQIDRFCFDEIFDDLGNSQNDINNKLEVIESIANGLDDENASDEEWMAAYKQISDLLGIHIDIEEDDLVITDEYIQTLIDECRSLNAEAWSIDGYLNENIYGNLSGMSDEYRDIITVSPCDDLVESELVRNEYFEFKLTDGSSIYIKTSDNTFELIDFQKNIHFVMYAKEGTKLARSLKRAGVLDRITSAMVTIKDFGDKISELMRLITTSLDTASETVLVWKENASKEHQKIFRALIQMGRDAKKTGKVNGIMRTTLRWQLKSLKSTIAAMEGCEKLLSKIGKGVSGLNLLTNIANAYTDLNGYITLYNHPKLNHCPDNNEGVQSIRNHIIAEGAGTALFYVLNIGLDIVSLDIIPTGIAGAPISAGSTLAAVGVAIAKLTTSVLLEKAHSSHVKQVQESIGDDILKLKCKDNKCPRCGKNPCECPDKCPRCGNKPCTCPDKCPKCGQNPCVCPPPHPQIPPIRDPSGYVFEGISSNRLQGVTATAYYKETVEDMYGDLHENIVKWDAEEYAQENPLFTDENGMYQWDVPQGLWQVKFEKEGYETTYSEWLPVPPPQLEVNIPMVQSRQPEVKTAHAYEDGVEVEFDKYMMPESLTSDNIQVTRNGEKLEGTIELLDEEVSYEGEATTFASRVKFVPANEETLISTDEVVLTVSQKVKSYAGLQMQESYTQAFDVEKAVRKIVVEEQAFVPYEGEHELLVSAQPYDAAVGKTLKVKTASKKIADVMTDKVQTDEDGIMKVTLDEDGQATLTLTGELPGATALTFSIEDANVTAQTMVSVKDDSQINTKAPVASRASGSALYSGTEITLSSKTGSAVIYYTLDGSCPCDETKRIKYDGPIVVTGDMTIKAMAQGSGMYESDVVTFTYTIKKTKVDVSLQEGWNWISHNMAEAQDAAKVFKNALEVKSQTRGLINDEKFGMIGNLKDLLPTAAYKVKAKSAESIVLSGNEYNAGANAISLKKGWNWIGFPVNQTLSLDEAFAKSSPQEGDYITGQKGYAEYLTDGGWIGTLEVLTPGKGYMYQSTMDNSITYNTALVSNAKSRYGHAAVKRYVAPWAVNIYQYPNIMPVTADLFVDGVKADADAYTVAAFCGTECRGVGQYVKGVLFLSVYGDGNENITFYASDNATDEVYDITEQMPFAADCVGSYNAPFAMHVGGKATEIANLNAQFKVSPTVAHDGVTVTLPSGHIDRLTVVSTGGVPVLSQHNLSVPAQINVAALPEGIYIVVAVSEGKTYYRKIVKVN